MKFCSKCGARVELRTPPEDDRPRHVCDACDTIHYQNPRMVVGAIPEWKGKILLCRRAIEPRHGLWTLPAGFLENGETVAEGARREAIEEACAELDNLEPYALFDLTFVNQVYFWFRARVAGGKYSTGKESLEVGLFSREEIPWDDIAFTVVQETLDLYFNDLGDGIFPFHVGRIYPGDAPE